MKALVAVLEEDAVAPYLYYWSPAFQRHIHTLIAPKPEVEACFLSLPNPQDKC